MPLINSDDKKVVSRAYSKASYSINPQKRHAISVMRVSCTLESNPLICKVVYIYIISLIYSSRVLYGHK